MENKNTLKTAGIILLLVWLLALTIAFFFLLSRPASPIVNNGAAQSAAVSVPVTSPSAGEINPSTQLSSFTVDNNGKIFGKYDPKSFASFDGSLVSKVTSKIATSSSEYTVLIVSGYLTLKNDVSSSGEAPVFQQETKYIEIGKNTKIVDDKGNAMTAADLSPEDYLVITPSDADEYPDTYMLASQITVTKKVWQNGTDPFN